MAAATTLGGSLCYAIAGTVIDASNETVTILCGAALAAIVVPIALALPRSEEPRTPDEPRTPFAGGTPQPGQEVLRPLSQAD
jgi:hypothetical protein